MVQSILWKVFYSNKTLYQSDRTHKNAWCNFCLEMKVKVLRELDSLKVMAGTLDTARSTVELQKEALIQLPPICGKLERLRAHITSCKLIPADTRTVTLLTDAKARGKENNTVNQSSVFQDTEPRDRPPKRSKTCRSIPNKNGVNPPFQDLSPAQLQETFSADLCKLLISLNTAWAAANNPQLHEFVAKWVGPQVVVEDRRKLSGSVLDKEAMKVEEDICHKVEGKLATGQCDGWKNVAKSSVVSSMMTVENEPYLIKTHDVTRDAKTGDHLLKLVLNDIELMEKKYGVKVIAWCTDDGPDGKKMRRLLQAQFPWFIVLLCWAHQINLIVGDFLAIRRSVTDDVNQAIEVIKWFNNHGTALELLRQEQVITFDNRTWALIVPALTRWTAHYQSVTRLLKVKQPIQVCWARHGDRLIVCAGTRAELKEKARSIQAIVRDDDFWDRIKRIQQMLEPLAIAANIVQASHTRLDHIIITFGNLYRIYSTASGLESDLRDGILQSLEKRWKKADQHLFIAAVFLNPYLRGRLFQDKYISDADIYSIVEGVYERLLHQKADLNFLIAFEDYKRGEQEFSDDRMSLDMMKAMFKKEGKPLDIRRIWSRLDKGVKEGRNGLVKLAIHIFTVIANSAGCERTFSNFGITHTKLRNKINAEKVHKMTSVKMSIRREHQDAGLVQSRKKRKYGEMVEESESSAALAPGSDLPIDSAPPTNFCQCADQLIRDAELSDSQDDPLEADVLVALAPAFQQGSSGPARGAVTATRTRTSFPKITLEHLFNYALQDHDENLGFYWKGGIANLAMEELAHDLLYNEEEMASGPSTAVTTLSD